MTEKVIAPEQARVGMHVKRIGSSWIDHPFWFKTSFEIRSDDQLRKIMSCGLPITIDTSKGCDVAEPRQAVAAGHVPASARVALVAEAASAASSASAAPSAASAAPGPAAAPASPLAKPPEPPRKDAATASHRATRAPSQPQQREAAPRSDLAEERNRARALVKQSVQYVRSLHDEVRLGNVMQVVQASELVDDITSSLQRHPSALLSLVRLKSADDYTYLHSVSVCALMVAVARELKMDAEQCRHAGIAGLLHDMGKARVPLHVLNKEGKLTDAEFDVMRSHPQWGYDLIKQAGFDHEVALDVALHHHERVDGTGYPHRLAGEQISIMARMGAVCDVYDAVTSERCYKPAWQPAVALRRMASWQGHFDKSVFQAFVKVVGIYPVGSLVRLRSNRLGVVLEQGEGSLLKPAVRVFYSLNDNMPIPEQTLRLDRVQSRDEIVSIESPETWGFTDLERLLD